MKKQQSQKSLHLSGSLSNGSNEKSDKVSKSHNSPSYKTQDSSKSSNENSPLYYEHHQDSPSSPHSNSNEMVRVDSHEDLRASSAALDLTVKQKNLTKNFIQQQQQKQQQQKNNTLLLSISNMAGQPGFPLSKPQHPQPQQQHQKLVAPVNQFMKANPMEQSANMLQNLNANQLLASYLNQLKFPFSLGNPAPNSASSPYAPVAEDLSMKMSQRKEQLNNLKPIVNQNKDVLDLSLPNRSRQSKEKLTDSSINLKSSISSSTISSLSPLSSISNLSESNAKYEDEDSTALTNNNIRSSLAESDVVSQVQGLKKQAANKRRRCESEQLAQMNKKPKLSNQRVDSARQQSQQDQSQDSLLTKVSNLLSSFSSQQNLLNLLLANQNLNNNNNNQDMGSNNNQNQLLNQLSNMNMLSNFNMLNNGINPLILSQLLNNNNGNIKSEPELHQQQQQQQQQQPSIEQLLQYSNYMKMMESYQKKLMPNEVNNSSNNSVFNQAAI